MGNKKFFAETRPNKIVENINEMTVRQSSYDPTTFENPYNPDDIYKKHGDYSIYDSMRRDDQISICLQMKKDLVLGAGFSFVAKEAAQKETVMGLTKIFEEDTIEPFDEQLEEILSAYEYGFSISEKIFALDNNYLTFKEFKTRHPNTWLIELDDKGNIESYKQRGVKQGDIEIKENALLHYVNAGRFQNPYGESDLRTAYQAWFAKREIIKYFAIFLEKAASPIPVAKYAEGFKQEQKESLLNILKKFQAKTALVLPKSAEIDFLEHGNKGEAYRSAINLFNMFIGRCLFIPDLLGFQGDETSGGSYSLGKEQMRVFFMHIGRRRKYLERLINKHLVSPICAYNWGLLDSYPKFKFNPISEESAHEAIKTWVEVVKTNAFKPNDNEINYVRQLLNFPEGEVQQPTQVQGATFGTNPGNNSDPTTKLPTEDNLQEQEVKQFAKLKDFPFNYHKKVDFKKIETQLDSYLDSTMDALRPVVKYIYQDLNDQIEKKKILSSRDITRADDLKVKRLKDIKVIVKNAFRDQYQDAKLMAQQELFKVNYALPLPNDEFMQFLEDETYSMVGDWAYKITARAKQELIAAIKDGKPLSEVQNILMNDGMSMSDVSLERYARTKFTEVMNRGRLDYFESSEIVQGYQYSAILDGSTSEWCESLSGKIFKAGEQPIPPLHFNCRSVLIPITKYEEVKKFGEVPEWIKEAVEGMKFSIQ